MTTDSTLLDVGGAVFRAEWTVTPGGRGELIVWPSDGLEFMDGIHAQWADGHFSVTASTFADLRHYTNVTPGLLQALALAMDIPAVKAAVGLALERKACAA